MVRQNENHTESVWPGQLRGYCDAVDFLGFMVEHRVLRFHFALDLEKFVAGPVITPTPLLLLSTYVIALHCWLLPETFCVCKHACLRFSIGVLILYTFYAFRLLHGANSLCLLRTHFLLPLGSLPTAMG